MEIRKPILGNAEQQFEKKISNRLLDAEDAALNAMPKEEFDNYEKETDELMRQALNGEISDEDFKKRMEKLENPPSAVNFSTIAELSRFLTETKVPSSEMHVLDDQNGFLNRANVEGLNGRYQLVFFQDEGGRIRSRPRVVASFPDTMSAQERAALYKKIMQGWSGHRPTKG